MLELGVRREMLGDEDEHSEAASGHTPMVRLLADYSLSVPALRTKLQELRGMFAYCRGSIAQSDPDLKGSVHAHDEPPLAMQIGRIRKFYDPILDSVYDNAVVRARDLEQLAQIATRYRSRSRFITDLTLDPPRATSDLAQPPFLEEDWLTLSTIHSAKGCEWKVVHILHAADGMIPSDMAVDDAAGIDEERRLFYVAMTRAKDMMYVYFPLRYYHRRFALGDAHNYAQLTRFVTPSARKLFSEKIAGAEAEDGSSILSAKVRDPYVRVNRLWHD